MCFGSLFYCVVEYQLVLMVEVCFDVEFVFIGDVFLYDFDLWLFIVVMYNIYGVIGIDGIFFLQCIVQVFKEINVDVVVLQEVFLGGFLQLDVLFLLRKEIGFFVVEGLIMESVECCYGNVVLSCYFILVKQSIDLFFGSCELCGVLDVDIDCYGYMLCVIVIYLGFKFVEWCVQIKWLLQVFDID